LPHQPAMAAKHGTNHSSPHLSS